jgi:predicted lipoprotein with Yx(FWY)xxD motif
MKYLTLIAAAVLATGCASKAPGSSPVTEQQGRLTDAKGMTLYTFKKDTPNTSNCNDNCAKVWPAFVVRDPSKAGGDLGIVKRKDGTEQWAFKGQPLYFYSGDTAAGQANGDGNGGTWFVVRRNAAAAPSTGYSY